MIFILVDWLKEKDPLLVFEYEISKFCNAIGCEGYSRPLRYVTAEYLNRFYYIFKKRGNRGTVSLYLQGK